MGGQTLSTSLPILDTTSYWLYHFLPIALHELPPDQKLEGVYSFRVLIAFSRDSDNGHGHEISYDGNRPTRVMV